MCVPPDELSNTMTGPIVGLLVRVVNLDVEYSLIIKFVSVGDIELTLSDDGLANGPNNDVCAGLVSVPIERDTECVGLTRSVHKSVKHCVRN